MADLSKIGFECVGVYWIKLSWPTNYVRLE